MHKTVFSQVAQASRLFLLAVIAALVGSANAIRRTVQRSNGMRGMPIRS
jgi:hypothetical protein